MERVPRAREVGQGYVTSVFTTLVATVASIWLVLTHCPRLVSVSNRWRRDEVDKADEQLLTSLFGVVCRYSATVQEHAYQSALLRHLFR